MVMASQFESLLEPFIIIFTIPLALTGVLLMLWVTNTSISVTSMVGLILLTGIVVNNGIVMIDYIKILQARGIERSQAVVTGAVRRLRPILMTAFTTILSMVPLALEIGSGSETWSPMARTVIGGLTMLPHLSLLSFSGAFLVLGYGVAVQLVTLPVELDASFKKALPLLSTGYISDAQLGPSKIILRAAALTYVAGTLIQLFNFWRWVSVLRR